MWPFKNKTELPAEDTLKQRVRGFWQWYAAEADCFFTAIEERRSRDLVEPVSEAVDRWLPGMAWVFGPGAGGVGHSFTLSGEGVLAKQLVAEYWLEQAPSLPGWTFHASRQPAETIDNFSIELEHGGSFALKEFWVATYVDEQTEQIDLHVWHPRIHEAEDRARWSGLFIVLDELLGEHGTQGWIGEVKFSEDRLADAAPVAELRDLIGHLRRDKGWEKGRPTDVWTSYELKERSDEWLRGDTIAGTTRGFVPLRSYLNAHGPCEHPLPGWGVDFVFVVIDRAHFPAENVVEARTQLADAIDEALRAERSGLGLGGATGTRFCYIDFVLWDGSRSLEIMRDGLRRAGVPKSTEIHFMTADQDGRVVRV